MTLNVNYTSDSKIAQITLDKPNNNALDLKVLKDLANAFKKSSINNDKCVLFKATGKNFTVGVDLKFIHSLLNSGDKNGFQKLSQAFQNLTRVMLNHPGIIIVGLHGWVVGGGFEISLAADLRYATEDTRIKLPELSLGIGFSNASTKLLGQIIGTGRAKELMLLGEEISSFRGYEIGLINGICKINNLEIHLENLANKIKNEIDPTALKFAKDLIQRNVDLPINDVLINELEVLNKLSHNKGLIAKINSFMNR